MALLAQTALLIAMLRFGLGQRPNVVVILADDLGWNDVSFHGSNQILTPNIDALAYNGVILNTHYVPALCTPSRASLLTGKYPTSLGMQHLVILADEPWGLPLKETLMPRHFKNHGYSTHAIGKWHLGFHRKEYTPTYRGFDTHFGYWNGYQDYYDHTMEATDEQVEPVRGYDMRRGMELDFESLGRYSTDLYTEEAVGIIERHNGTEGPLFLYLAHLAPHAGNSDKPYQAPDDEVAKHMHIKDPERRVYAAMISRMDSGVGEVMAALRRRGMLDNTIVLFMSDNGAVTFGAHSNHGSNFPLRGLKESPWEGGVRGVAALWSPLLNKTQRVSNQMMHMSDWLPTLFSAAGLDPAELGEIDGRDMWAVLSDGLESPRTEVFNNYDEIEDYSSLRMDDWKYVAGTAQDGEVDAWYGDPGVESEQVEYDLGKILQSQTNIAISGYLTDRQLAAYGTGKSVHDLVNKELMLQLRRSSVITCEYSRERLFELFRHFNDSDVLHRIAHVLEGRGHVANGSVIDFDCNPIGSTCLFHLTFDPCERFNLATAFPDVVDRMEQRLVQLKRTVASPLNTPGEPFAHPAHHNYTWTNWSDFEPEDASRTIADLLFNLLSSFNLPTSIYDNVLFKIVSTPVLGVTSWLAQLFVHAVKSLLSTLALVFVAVASLFILTALRKLITLNGCCEKCSISFDKLTQTSSQLYNTDNSKLYPADVS